METLFLLSLHVFCYKLIHSPNYLWTNFYNNYVSPNLKVIFKFRGNHRWWWKAFISPACTSVFVFLYSIFYFMKYIRATRLSSIVMYFGLMGLISFNFFIICGFCGLASSYFFIYMIYSMIKIE